MKTGGGKGIKKEMDKEERRIRQKKDNYYTYMNCHTYIRQGSVSRPSALKQ